MYTTAATACSTLNSQTSGNYDLYLNFVKERNQMRKKFRLFEPIYVNRYDPSFRKEGSEFRHTFFGIKK